MNSEEESVLACRSHLPVRSLLLWRAPQRSPPATRNSVGASACGRGLPRRPAPTAAIGTRRGYRTRMRTIPRRRDDKNRPISINQPFVAQSRGIRRQTAVYPRLCTIAAVVSRATRYCSPLQTEILSIGLKQQDLYIVVKCSRRDEVIEDSPM